MAWFSGHALSRSPLSPSVPLDGTDTVRGLRALERLSLVGGEKAQSGVAHRHTPVIDTGRRHYKRYKGPFLEQLTLEDVQATPKPWGTFMGGPTAYSLPASMTVLQERLEVRPSPFPYSPRTALSSSAVHIPSR
jgi:hypothetical protein